MSNFLVSNFIDNTGVLEKGSRFSIQSGVGTRSFSSTRKIDGVRAQWLLSDGRRYEGLLFQGKLHGKGIITEEDGVVCESQWNNGRMYGHVTYRFPWGDFWEGKWINDYLINVTHSELTKTFLFAANSMPDCLGEYDQHVWPHLQSALESIVEMKPELRKPILTVLKGLTFSAQRNLPKLEHSIQNRLLTFIPTGWCGHIIVAVVYRDRFLLCNRDDGSPTTKMFRIQSKDFLSQLNRMLAEESNPKEQRKSYLYEELPDLLHAEIDPICVEFEKGITTGPQKAGNCWYVSCKESIKGALALALMDQGFSVQDAVVKANELKKICSAIVRMKLLHEYKSKVNLGKILPLPEAVLAEIERKTKKSYEKAKIFLPHGLERFTFTD